MRKLFALSAAVMIGAFAAVPASAQTASFGYSNQQPPSGGDCSRGAAWYGEFAGNYYDNFRDTIYPFSARGCFDSEAECRSWQGAQAGYAGRGGIIYTRCRAGSPD